MRVIHVSYSDSGGAGRAAYRIHSALRDNGTESVMKVIDKSTGDYSVNSVVKNLGEKIIFKSKEHLTRELIKYCYADNRIIHSIAVLPSRLPNILNESDADVINMHWVGKEMLSVKDISKINKPIIWTLHDMWAFCGAEHVSYEDRYERGYSRNNGSLLSKGFDINRWTWERKKKYWNKSIEIVTPSHWMADCVKRSTLMTDWPVTVIPNPLDTQKWRPIDKNIARELLGYPKECPLIAFGSYGENQSPHKGLDLLKAAFIHLKKKIERLKIIIIGQSQPKVPEKFSFPVIYGGFMHDDISLRLLYSAVDAIIVPSRVESFSQMASEAHACGTPVIAFNVGGLRDIIENHKTGYLAKAFEPEDLAEGINWVLSDINRHKSLGINAREKAIKMFDKNIISDKYMSVYNNVVKT